LQAVHVWCWATGDWVRMDTCALVRVYAVFWAYKKSRKSVYALINEKEWGNCTGTLILAPLENEKGEVDVLKVLEVCIFPLLRI